MTNAGQYVTASIQSVRLSLPPTTLSQDENKVDTHLRLAALFGVTRIFPQSYTSFCPKTLLVVADKNYPSGDLAQPEQVALNRIEFCTASVRLQAEFIRDNSESGA